MEPAAPHNEEASALSASAPSASEPMDLIRQALANLAATGALQHCTDPMAILTQIASTVNATPSAATSSEQGMKNTATGADVAVSTHKPEDPNNVIAASGSGSISTSPEDKSLQESAELILIESATQEAELETKVYQEQL